LYATRYGSNPALVACYRPRPAIAPRRAQPTNFLRDFALLSVLSAFGSLCVLLIVGVVVYGVFLRVAPDGAADPPHTQLADVSGLAMSSSIMLAGLTGHVALPPMYAEMRKPSAFRRVLYSSFMALFLVYAVVGCCGYATYGSDAAVLLTHDMSRAWSDVPDSSSGAWLGQLLVNLVLGGISFKMFCTVRARRPSHCEQRLGCSSSGTTTTTVSSGSSSSSSSSSSSGSSSSAVHHQQLGSS
jgi:hypothetical protein